MNNGFKRGILFAVLIIATIIFYALAYILLHYCNGDVLNSLMMYCVSVLTTSCAILILLTQHDDI